MKNILLLLCLVVTFFSCNNSKSINVERAFYYWKSYPRLSVSESQVLNQSKIKKMYIKYFEVDYSDAMGNYPYDKFDNYSYEYLFTDLDSISIVPTVFIKNGIFKYNSEKDLDVLADNIVFLINKRNNELLKSENKNLQIFDEIQIDCDWTKTTKDKYFYLLRKIKELSKKQISCTLRLYPYKYKDIMGVPPVDKATLMCYNLIKPLSQTSKNSILDIKELKLYLNKRQSYPIHLDVALPVFNWAQLYHDNHFEKLVRISSEELLEFCKPIKPMWYEVTKDREISWNEYYRVGDLIKCEEVNKNTIDEAIKIIKNNVELDNNTTIILFDLDESITKKYTHEEITSFYTAFSK